MLGNSYCLNVLKSECLSTWDYSWLLTVYLFLWNLKVVCKLPYKFKSAMLISNFFQLEIEFYCEKHLRSHTLIIFEFEANKKWKNGLSNHLFFYRLWHTGSFINLYLDIIYGFPVYASEIRLWYTHTKLYFTIFVQ